MDWNSLLLLFLQQAATKKIAGPSRLARPKAPSSTPFKASFHFVLYLLILSMEFRNILCRDHVLKTRSVFRGLGLRV